MQTARVVQTEIRVKGKIRSVASVQVDGRSVFTTGQWLKIAAVREEELVEGPTLADPECFIASLRESGLGADLFTFAQRLPEDTPRYHYHIEWENAAAIPVTTFSQWWTNGVEYSIRKAVNRGKKLGVIVRVAEFNEEFVEATCPIYNETPVRQGKTFWHYGKDSAEIHRDLTTYLERSTFIAAYCKDELIGFMKFTSVGRVAVITQILSAKRHFDKRPNNALIAKAVEICEQRGLSHFVYGSYVYYDPNSSLTEFKRRHGFQPIALPRYYIPLTLKGEAALRLRLYRGIAGNTPAPVLAQLFKLRTLWCTLSLKAVKSAQA
jgi:Acetyltransferase (GNAT) domain